MGSTGDPHDPHPCAGGRHTAAGAMRPMHDQFPMTIQRVRRMCIVRPHNSLPYAGRFDGGVAGWSAACHSARRLRTIFGNARRAPRPPPCSPHVGTRSGRLAAGIVSTDQHATGGRRHARRCLQQAWCAVDTSPTSAYLMSTCAGMAGDCMCPLDAALTSATANALRSRTPPHRRLRRCPAARRRQTACSCRLPPRVVRCGPHRSGHAHPA